MNYSPSILQEVSRVLRHKDKVHLVQMDYKIINKAEIQILRMQMAKLKIIQIIQQALVRIQTLKTKIKLFRRIMAKQLQLLDGKMLIILYLILVKALLHQMKQALKTLEIAASNK